MSGDIARGRGMSRVRGDDREREASSRRSLAQEKGISDGRAASDRRVVSRVRGDDRERETPSRRSLAQEKGISDGRAASHGRVASDRRVASRGRGTDPRRDGARGRRAARRKRRKRIAVMVRLFLLLILGAGAWLYVDSLAYGTVRVEAGIQVAASDFLKKADDSAVFTQDSQPFDITEPGEYQVKVKSGLFTHRCTLIIEDTIAPKARAVPVQCRLGETCGAEAFAADISDATRVAVSYVTEPDFDSTGPQEVQILLTDKGGNRTVLESELYMVQLAEDVTVEAGGEIPGLDGFVMVAREASFITEMEEIDSTQVGDYEILLDISGETFSAMLHIVDTLPPRLEVQDIQAYAMVPRKPEDFVTLVEDMTPVELGFRKEPDLTLIGSQEVEIVAVDGGGNETVRRAALTLQEDREAPVIEGASDLTYFIGESISYRKNVKVTDNSGEEIPLEVDTSGVDFETEGVYPVLYTATDASGNAASVTVNLTVRARMYSLEEMYAYADAVVEQIVTPDMSLRDKAWAVYCYVVNHVAYITHSEKGDWIRAAYEGLVEGKGDCYVYACTAKALLTRADVPNLDITKIPTRSEHYWNLVDVGEGWYHFDTTPRPDHPTIFLWTDEEMMAYSALHYNAYNYDRALYPEVN